MESTLSLKIVTPHGSVYEDDVTFVTLPTQAGEITIHPMHAPLISLLIAGEIVVRKDGENSSLAVSSGIIEMRPDNQLYVVADTAEHAADIDIERAQRAKERAEELMKQQKDAADVDFARMRALIEKEMARISTGKKYRG